MEPVGMNIHFEGSYIQFLYTFPQHVDRYFPLTGNSAIIHALYESDGGYTYSYHKPIVNEPSSNNLRVKFNSVKLLVLPSYIHTKVNEVYILIYILTDKHI